jgi:modulator of FtsH protease HflC
MDKTITRRVALGIGAATAIVLVWGSFFYVDQTELANVRRFGTALYPPGQPLEPGLHFKLPLVDTADVVRVTLQTIHIPPFDVLTVDNQKVTIEENFNYTIAKDQFYHVTYQVGSSGHLDSDTIAQQVVPVAKDRTARVLAAQNMVAVNANREVIQAQIEKNVTLAVESLFGISAHSLQIARIEPSANFMKSIDEATMAKNAAIRAENDLRTRQFEAQQVAATAKGQADAAIEHARGASQSVLLNAAAEQERLIRVATGEAEARKTTSAAEAQAQEVVGLAMAKSLKAQTDALSAGSQFAEYTKALRWNGALPTSMYAGAPIPFLNLGAPK